MIEYATSAEGITPADVDDFFVGWPTPPSREARIRLLEGSDHVVVARDGEHGRIVGFVTAVSDGVLSAYLPLLEVLPEHQGLGIGTELVRRMLELLDDLYMVDLCCDEDLVPFYERLGMSRLVAMGRRNVGAVP